LVVGHFWNEFLSQFNLSSSSVIDMSINKMEMSNANHSNHLKQSNYMFMILSCCLS